MRRSVIATAIVALVFLTGCGPIGMEASGKNWAASRKPDTSCLGDVTLVSEDYYDLNGDGHNEVFLVMRCKDHRADPPGDLFEVLAHGDDGPPTKLVVQIWPQPSVVDQLCFTARTAIYRVTAADGESEVRQVNWPAGSPEPGPFTPGPDQPCPSPKRSAPAKR